MKEKLTPHWKYLKKFKDMDQEHKQEQKANFDRRYQAKVLKQEEGKCFVCT